MTTPIPNQFQFMNQTWTIRPAQYHELREDMGECDATKNTIKINPSLAPDVLLQTIFHEIIHSWEITLHANLTEQQTDLMAVSLVHFFKTNPQWAAIFVPEQVNDSQVQG